MSIFVDSDMRVLVQGITGKEGQFHTRQCVEYGTNVVAGVTPGKGGRDMDGIPVFNRVAEAAKQTGANCSMIFVPPPFASEFIKAYVTKPVVGFVAGMTAPPGRRMGHAGAIISGSSGTAQAKISALKRGGVHVCENQGDIGEMCAEVFKFNKDY